MIKIMKYENWWAHRKRLYWIADKIKNCKDILDVGCGTGTYLTIPLNLIAKSNSKEAEIKGLDIGLESIKRAQANAILFEINEEYFLCGDIREHSQTYDAVICSEVLEHIDNADINGFVNSLCNLVKEEGILIITVPNGKGSFERGKRIKKSKIGSGCIPKLEIIMQTINIKLFKKYLYFEEDNSKESQMLNQMTVTMTEHVQFFAKNDIITLMEKCDMKLVEFTGSCLFSGVWITLLPPFQVLTKVNNWLGKKYPDKASGYYFVFSRK